jgi:ribosomal protein S7
MKIETNIEYTLMVSRDELSIIKTSLEWLVANAENGASEAKKAIALDLANEITDFVNNG